MASNFKITIYQNSDSLHLKLRGDFDGSSACQLLDLLEKYHKRITRIFIHTKSLKHIYPFGRDLFIGNLKVRKEQFPPIAFTGERAPDLKPERDGEYSIAS